MEISAIIGFAIVTVLILLPGFFVILTRTAILQPYDKVVVYLCAEISYLPERWDSRRIKDRINRGDRLRPPFKAIAMGLFNPVLCSVRALSAIWCALVFVFFLAMIGVSSADLGAMNGIVMLILMSLLLVVTVFLYYYRSVASDLSLVEERAVHTVQFLKEIGWGEVNDKRLQLVQEQMMLDYDLYKTGTGVGGILLLVFTSLSLFYARLNDAMPLIVAAPFLVMLASIVFFRWVYESYRSRVVQIALNAILMLRKTKTVGEGVQETAN